MYDLPAGLNQAVKKMQRNEISRIGCAHDLALTDKVFEKLKIKPQVRQLIAIQSTIQLRDPVLRDISR